jgi:N-acetyl-alpha-D-muramate 1-phosphate uridylyltransferase
MTEATRDSRITHAMILAAGLGTRMRPLTDTRPKPLIEIGGKAMIDWILGYCRDAGVSDAVVNVHYLADMIEAHVRNVASPRIRISDERAALLDSGGGVLKALPHLGGGDFYVLNADAVWIDGPRPSLLRLADHWNPDEMDVLLLLAHSSNATGWGNKGDFALDQQGRLRRPAPGEVTPFVYGGAGIWKSSLFEGRPEKFSLNRIFDEAIARGRLCGLRLDGLWMHVGTPDAIPEAEAAILRTGK